MTTSTTIVLTHSHTCPGMTIEPTGEKSCVIHTGANRSMPWPESADTVANLFVQEYGYIRAYIVA